MGVTDAMLFAMYPVPMKGLQPEPLLEAPFYFHTPPGSYSRSGGVARAKQQLYKVGERAAHGGPALRSVSWSSMFAITELLFLEAQEDGYPAWVQTPPDDFQFQGAMESRNIIDDLHDAGEIVKLIVKDPNSAHAEINMLAQIVGFDFGNIEAEPDVRQYSITFEQWKPTIINTVTKAGLRPGQKGPATVAGALKPQVKNPYTLPRAMTLREISFAAYKNASYGPQILAHNGGKKWLATVKAKHIGMSKKGQWQIPKGTKVKLPTKK